MQFNDGSGWQTVPQMAINSVVYANYATRAENLGNYPATDYLRPANLPTCTGSQALSYDGTVFTCIAAGGGAGGVTTVTGTLPVVISGATSTPVVSMAKATSAVSGYLSSADWTTFNGKASGTLNSGQLYLGNGSNAATGVVLSGDASLANTGIMTLSNSGVGAGTYGSSNAVPSLTIDSKGRVTSATSAAYQDATNVGKGIVQIGTNLTISSGTLSMRSADITSALGYTPLGAGTIFINGGNTFSSDATLGVNDNYKLQFKTNNLTRVTIDSAGQVGIGTTTPVNGLQVTSGISVGPQAFIFNSNSSIESSKAGDNYLYLNGSARSGGLAMTGNGLTTASQADLHFRTGVNWGGDWTATGTENLTMLTSGYVGIGTSTPSGILDVRGGTAAASTNGTDINLIAQSSATSTFKGGNININAGSGFGGEWYNAGNVAILANNFSVQGSATGSASVAIGPQSTAQSQASVALGWHANTTAMGASVLGNYTTSSGEYAVGIGNVNRAPAYSSVVVGACNAIAGTENATTWVTTDPIFVVGNGTIPSGSATCSTTANAMTILKSGNVGIGTTTPTLKLQVTGAIASAFVNTAWRGTPTFDASQGNTFKMTMTGTVTSSFLINAVAGQSLNFIICEDAAAGWTFTWPPNFKGGMSIAGINAGSSKCFGQSFIFDGTTAYATSAGAGGSAGY